MREPFEAGQEAAEARRRELDLLREDVRAAVRDEVGRAGVSEAELKRMVREVVRAEMGASAPRTAAPRAHLWLVGGLVVGVLGGVLGYRALADTSDGSTPSVDAGAEATAVAGPATDVPEADPPAPPPTPEERASRWDSLVAARSPDLEPMMRRLEAAAPAAPVQEALATWRGGDPLGDAAARRLHDALVQLTLNDVGAAGLALDGLVTRGPCRGNSCGALLRVWQQQGEALGMPPYPADAAAADEALRVAERALLLGRVEGAGG